MPFIVIFSRSILDNKVHNKESIESILSAPFLGEIPNSKLNGKIVISKKGSQSVSEAFRLLRANLNFILSSVKSGSKSIFITSTIGGEGKSFIAINLAEVLAASDKRVLLIGADLRKPMIDEYLEMDSSRGLTHYLAGIELNILELINSNEKVNFDFLSAGEIPPNPSELLMNGLFSDVLKFGYENYDFVIVDTSPVSLVSDTLILNKYADMFIYVIRAKYLEKDLLKVPKMMHQENRLNNMTILLNDTDRKNSNYGYGFGYNT